MLLQRNNSGFWWFLHFKNLRGHLYTTCTLVSETNLAWEFEATTPITSTRFSLK